MAYLAAWSSTRNRTPMESPHRGSVLNGRAGEVVCGAGGAAYGRAAADSLLLTRRIGTRTAAGSWSARKIAQMSAVDLLEESVLHAVLGACLDPPITWRSLADQRVGPPLRGEAAGHISRCHSRIRRACDASKFSL